MLVNGRRVEEGVPAAEITQHDEEYHTRVERYLAYLRELESRIRAFEVEHDMSTEDLIDALDSGQIEETADHVRWIMAFRAWQHEKKWQAERSTWVAQS